MNQPENSVGKLRLLLNEIEESILSISDEEILEESRSAGKDPEAVADQVESLICSSIKGHRQKKLRVAQEGYRQLPIPQKRRNYAAPDTVAKPRAFLNSILAKGGNVPKEITMAFREGGYMSDNDAANILDDLAKLGWLGEEDEGND